MSAPQDGHACSNAIVVKGGCEVTVEEVMVDVRSFERMLIEEEEQRRWPGLSPAASLAR